MSFIICNLHQTLGLLQRSNMGACDGQHKHNVCE